MQPRDATAIDRELELLASVTASIRRLGGNPSTRLIDDLLDERLKANAPTTAGAAARP